MASSITSSLWPWSIDCKVIVGGDDDFSPGITGLSACNIIPSVTIQISLLRCYHSPVLMYFGPCNWSMDFSTWRYTKMLSEALPRIDTELIFTLDSTAIFAMILTAKSLISLLTENTKRRQHYMIINVLRDWVSRVNFSTVEIIRRKIGWFKHVLAHKVLLCKLLHKLSSQYHVKLKCEKPSTWHNRSKETLNF